MGLVHCLGAALVFILGLSSGQRVVTIQKGLLYRVKGSHVTLWCRVSGYQGPAEQNFQWSIYLPSAPEREVQIVSTADPSFPYAIYTQRVRSREIYVERLQGDAAQLHITELQDRDAGEYECHTPTTDEKYFGSYSAKMNLSVIADTLSVSMGPQALTCAEGDTVELTCEVSKSTTQHTHLSVGLYRLQEAGDSHAEEILTLSKDFVLRPGASYMQRFLAGDMRLDKVGNTTYKFSIKGVKPSDQGQLYCEAAEWIEDPDETWKDISRKQTEKTSLTVTNLGKDLHVTIAASESSLSEGDTLQLNCCVGAQNSRDRQFQVIWLLNSTEVARVDQSGVLIWKEEYEERASLGQLQAFKQIDTVYVLTVYEVGLMDKGVYSCSVSEVVKASGDFQSIQTKLSSGLQVNVKQIESRMRLSMSTSTAQIVAGDALIFLCEVRGTTNPLSVQWWHLQHHQGPPALVATMERDGSLTLGSAYRDRGAQGSIRLEKAGSSAFTLVISNTSAPSDGGSYRCEVVEWSRGKSWMQTEEIAVTVSPLDLGLHAVLISRTATVKYTQSFELFCQLSASYALEEVPVSVMWQFQPRRPVGDYQELVRVLPGGTVAWGTAQPHFPKKTQLTKAASSSRLLIHSATVDDEGTYRCEVGVWSRSSLPRGQPAAVVRSNAVGIKVTLPESKLQVATKESSVEISGSADTTIECRIVFAQKTAQLAITWYFLPPPPADATPLQIVRANYSNILEYGTEFSSLTQRSRFQSQRVSSNVFWLQILSTNHGDQGSYYCVVEEWLWLADGWYKLGEGVSGRTTLEFKLSESELDVEKTNSSISVREGTKVTVGCLLQGVRSPASRVSAIWFHGEDRSGARPLLHLHRDGTVEYVQESLAGRLHLRRPAAGDFSLTLQSVEEGDTGVYYCQVQEWQQDSKGEAWALQASALSGYTRLTTLPPESTVLSRICSSPPLLNFILYLPLVLILLLATAGFCWYLKFRKVRKENIKDNRLVELQRTEDVKQT
ncbi:immunoglobulin superfamily member 2 [Apteryx mantelli]|uniref:immunoglobulin superfamily member 2 n=1 Tax=Apteryx mantelli TaxID=2696672 RepID=UPI00351B4D0D